MEDVQREQELIKKAKAGQLVEKVQKEAPAPGAGLRSFNVFVDGEFFEVGVEAVGEIPVVASIAPAAQPVAPPKATPAAAPRAAVPPPPPKPAAAPAPAAAARPAPAPAQTAVATGNSVEAPMPGMIIRYEVIEGASVSEGDVLLVLEAMKMENSIASPASGTIKQIRYKDGDTVQKGDVLVVIG
jgi:pyruvate carboxylase subunit B